MAIHGGFPLHSPAAAFWGHFLSRGLLGGFKSSAGHTSAEGAPQRPAGRAPKAAEAGEDEWEDEREEERDGGRGKHGDRRPARGRQCPGYRRGPGSRSGAVPAPQWHRRPAVEQRIPSDGPETVFRD